MNDVALGQPALPLFSPVIADPRPDPVQPVAGGCLLCGKLFAPRNGGKKQVFCAESCRVKSKNAAAKVRFTPKAFLPIPCAQCGGLFTPDRSTGRFCNRNCNTNHRVYQTSERLSIQRRPIECYGCGKIFTPKKSDVKICSRACGNRYQSRQHQKIKKAMVTVFRYIFIKYFQCKVCGCCWDESKQLPANGSYPTTCSDKCKHELRRMFERKYTKDRRESDPEFKIAQNLRCRIYDAVVTQGTKKSARTEALIGCSFSFCRQYIESLMWPGMSWDNYGLWEIDHIIPVSFFNLLMPEEQARCFHYSNLQPLWKRDNREKKDSLNWKKPRQINDAA